jgi:hypothetical protein
MADRFSGSVADQLRRAFADHHGGGNGVAADQ